MPVPDFQSLMLPVLEIAALGETSVPLAEAEIAKRFGLSEDDRAELLPSGRQRILHNRVHWAKFYLSKAGLVETPKRGRFVTSQAGKQLLQSRPTRIDTQFLLTIPAFKAFHTANTDSVSDTTKLAATLDLGPAAKSPSSQTPEELIEAAYIEARRALRAELLERILQNDADFFERLIVTLLVAMGYGGSHRNAAEQLGKSGDGGVDGVINEDVLGLDRVYVQAKRFSPEVSAVGRPAVQSFVGSLVGLGASKGVFVTTTTFSQQAFDYVSKIPQRVILIDGGRLTDLMIEHGVGVRVSRVLEFKRADEDFFLDD